MTRTYLFGSRSAYRTLRNPLHFSGRYGYSSDQIEIRRTSANRTPNSPALDPRGEHWYTPDPTGATIWHVTYACGRHVCHSPREVRQLIERLIEQGRVARERDIQRRHWDALCDDQAHQVKQVRTAREVLAIAGARGLVAAIGDRKYTTDLDYYCTRKVQAQAIGIWRQRTERRAGRKIAEAARKPEPNRMISMLGELRAKRAKAAAERQRKALLAGKLGRKPLAELIAARKYLTPHVGGEADWLVRCVIAAVGTIGEQVTRDLQELATSEDFSGKRGRNHCREVTTVERIEHLRDWSAALVTFRDYRSYGSSRWGGERGYGSVGGSSFRCYLVVRDSTTKEAHILRVAPKFGNSETQFFGRFGSPAERIEAARASTFRVAPEVLAAAIES